MVARGGFREVGWDSQDLRPARERWDFGGRWSVQIDRPGTAQLTSAVTRSSPADHPRRLPVDRSGGIRGTSRRRAARIQAFLRRELDERDNDVHDDMARVEARRRSFVANAFGAMTIAWSGYPFRAMHARTDSRESASRSIEHRPVINPLHPGTP